MGRENRENLDLAKISRYTVLQLVKHLSGCFHVRAQFNNLKACFNMQVWTLQLLFLLLVGCHYAAGTCSTRGFTVDTLQPYDCVLM